MLTLIIICGLFCCLLVVFIFSLMKVGRKADIGEENLSSIMPQEISCENKLHNIKNRKLNLGITARK
jgi:hypothetical protein